MRRNLFLPVLAAVAMAGVGGLRAQSSGTNPDISVIGSFLLCPADPNDCAWSEADSELNFQEAEAAFQGYLNPYVRGDAFFAFHEGDFEVEEIFASFVRGLGPVQIRIGKYLVDWGSINSLHPHAYSWIFRPLVEERFFGEEGLNQIAANVNLSFPAGERGEMTFSGDLLRGDLAGHGPAAGHGGGGSGSGAGTICVGPGCADGICQPGDADCALVYYAPPVEQDEEGGPDLAWHLRAGWFDEFRPNHSIRVSVNGLQGRLDPDLDRGLSWYGADFKYRWRPDKYRSLNLIGAWIRSRADLEAEQIVGTTCVGPDCAGAVCPAGGVCQVFEETAHAKGGSLTTSGWYLIADWQFALQWNAGIKLDWSEGIESDDVIRRVETFVNWRLKEESTLFRLLFRREDADLYDSPENTVAVQFIFSLGPHRPHSF